MSCTLASVMRACPRMVLTRRDRRSDRVEAIAAGAAMRARHPAKVHSVDDSIVRPRGQSRPGVAGAGAGGGAGVCRGGAAVGCTGAVAGAGAGRWLGAAWRAAGA